MPSKGEKDHGDRVFVLRELRASTVHKDVALRAIGETGLASAAVSVPTFTTLRELLRLLSYNFRVFGVAVVYFGDVVGVGDVNGGGNDADDRGG